MFRKKKQVRLQVAKNPGYSVFASINPFAESESLKFIHLKCLLFGLEPQNKKMLTEG